MRTKVLLGAAALAASLATSMAQNVYSLNVVGYVNVTCPANQQTLIANPLDATLGGTVANGNTVSNLFSINSVSPLANNTAVFGYNSAAGNYNSPITYKTLTKTWSGGTGAATVINPGTGLVYNPGSTTEVITFVGQVVQGPYTVATLPGSLQTLVGAPVPIGGDLTNALTGLAPGNNDSVLTYNGALGVFSSPSTYKTLTKKWSPTTTINPGQGFVYSVSGASPNTWVCNFTVQ